MVSVTSAYVAATGAATGADGTTGRFDDVRTGYGSLTSKGALIPFSQTDSQLTSLMSEQEDPIPLSTLAQYDGSDLSKPIYVAIKGRVFDVSAKKDMYGKGAGYNVFAGKDASKGLGESLRLFTEVVEVQYSTLLKGLGTAWSALWGRSVTSSRTALISALRHVIIGAERCYCRLFRTQRGTTKDA